MPEEEKYISLGDCIEIINKRKLLIIFVTIASLIVAVIVNYITPPTYEAVTSIVIGKVNFNKDSQTQYSDILMYQSLVTTYSEIAKSVNVAEKTAVELHNNSTYSSITVDDISNALTVNPEKNSQIINISIKSKNPEEAKIIANALTDAFMTEAKRIYPAQDIQVMDAARKPKLPIAPNKKKNLIIALSIGLLLSVVLAFILENADNSIKSEEDAEKSTGIPVIGVIPYNKMIKN